MASAGHENRVEMTGGSVERRLKTVKIIIYKRDILRQFSEGSVYKIESNKLKLITYKFIW